MPGGIPKRGMFGVRIEFFSELVVDLLYHDCVEVSDLAKVDQSQNENSIKANFNYQGLFLVLQVEIGHSCILKSKISLASYCSTYHAVSCGLGFLLRIIIFKTRIRGFVQLLLRLIRLSPLRSGCVSLSRWFASLWMVDWFIMFSRGLCLLNFSFLWHRCCEGETLPKLVKFFIISACSHELQQIVLDWFVAITFLYWTKFLSCL
jgi:hypothetical protein